MVRLRYVWERTKVIKRPPSIEEPEIVSNLYLFLSAFLLLQNVEGDRHTPPPTFAGPEWQHEYKIRTVGRLEKPEGSSNAMV